MRSRFLLALPAALLILAGCSHNEPTDISPIPSASAVTDAHAMLSFPANVKKLASVPFTLSVTNGKTGAPISGLRATVGLEMPSMTMPPNVVRLSPQKPGVYTGSGTFTMAGKWQATAVYLDNSGSEGSQSFPVQVK